MPTHEEHDNHRTGNRRRRIAVGAAGAALVLGSTSYLVTGSLLDRQTTVPEPAAIAPVIATSTPASDPTDAPPTTAAAQAAAPPDEEQPRKRQKRDEEKEKAAPKAVKEITLAEQPVTTATENLADATTNVMTAGYDLTGKGHLRWAGDDGKPTGDGALCTNRFKFAGKKAEVKPGMVMCWRTSSSRSVVAITFGRTKDSRPAATETAEVVARHWAGLK